jgi:hypothetical protein
MTAVIVSPRARLALEITGTALSLGVLADLLLRPVPWGLNLTTWTLALLATGVWIVRRHRIPASPDARWLVVTAALCALAFVRRDSVTLRVLDGLTIVVVLALMALAAQGGSVRRRGISAYVLAVASAGIRTVAGSARLVFRDVRWSTLIVGRRWRALGAAGSGILIALPLLLVFGGLFVSADATFAAAAASIRLNVGSLVGHVVFTGLGAVLAAGYFHGALLERPADAAAGERLPSPGIPFVTTAVALGLVNALFVVFVAVQARWLFGGTTVVRAVTGLTLAQYARRGFFELVTAAALVLPLLLAADWATRRADPTQQRSFRALATLQVLLVGALLVSALQRMLLYVQAYGLTETRLYTTAFMVWLGGVFVWLVFTMLRGRRSRFALGALLQGLAVLAGLHTINPDAVIARVDASSTAAEVPFDAAYVATRLSGDAVPALLDALPHLSPAERTQVARRLLARWGGREPGDWRSWNYGGSTARTLVREQASALAGTTSLAPRRNP